MATSTNKGSFGNVKKTSSMTSPRAMALDATRWRPLVAEFRRVKGAQDDLCLDQWARWCSLKIDIPGYFVQKLHFLRKLTSTVKP